MGSDLDLSHGFSAGNYCNAYETEELSAGLAQRNVTTASEAYRAAFIMGFFGSYELHEISDDARERFDEAYHSDHGKRVLELGYTEARSEDYAKEKDGG